VKLSGERSSSPEGDGFDRFVGLDHIDPGDLRIRRWGDLATGSTFTSVFRPGQVLFGKRRAYQRKVAVADFSGVCSGDIYVLVPRNAHLLPELLPFICQTEGFFEHAVGTSAGSLSPRTNWDSLASFEFALPPMDDQRRIADVLSGMGRLVDCYREGTLAVAGLTQRFLLTEYQGACADAPMYKIGDVGEMKMGRQKAPKYSKGANQRPFLRVANMGELELHLEETEQMSFSDAELARFRLLPGDILLTEGDLISRFNVGRTALFRGEINDCCFQNTLIRFRPSDRLDAEYALLLLEGARLSGVFARAAKTTTVTHLGLGRLAEVSIPVPPLGHQRTATATFMALLNMRTALRERVRSSAALRSKFLAEALA
jgi:type I restriction enzyme S subunit